VSMLLLLLASLCLQSVDGHGYLVNPAMRGRFGEFRYEKQSLGAAGPGKDITICGRGGAINYLQEQGDVITQMPAPGSVFTFEAEITAHHLGHMIVRVCPFINGDFTRGEFAGCLRLAASDGSGDTWPLSADIGTKLWEATLPSQEALQNLNSSSGVFTIQWRWNTANSCAPSDQFAGNCDELRCCSEVFTNCADVVFEGIPNEAPAAPVDPPAPSPPSGGSSGSGGSPTGSGCVHQTDCSVSDWCNSAAEYGAWCQQHPANDCPTPQCVVGSGSDSGTGPAPPTEPGPGLDPGGDEASLHPSEADGDYNDCPTCKGECQKLCNANEGAKGWTATNQCYTATGSSQRYVECKCGNGEHHYFPGCGPPVTTTGPNPEPEPESPPEPEPESPPEPEPESSPEPEPEPEPSTADECGLACYSKYTGPGCEEAFGDHVSGCFCANTGNPCPTGYGMIQTGRKTKFSDRVGKVNHVQISADGRTDTLDMN